MSGYSQDELEQALARCAQEPIHQLGRIQPHGALIVVGAIPSRVVMQASSNLGDIVELTELPPHGLALAKLIGTQAAGQIEALIARTEGRHAASGRLDYGHDGSAHALHARFFRPEPPMRSN